MDLEKIRQSIKCTNIFTLKESNIAKNVIFGTALHDKKVIIMKFDWNALWESVKEPLRWLVLAILPFLIAYVVALPYGWAAFATVLLRIIDGYLHEHAPKGVAGGITRF